MQLWAHGAWRVTQDSCTQEGFSQVDWRKWRLALGALVATVTAGGVAVQLQWLGLSLLIMHLQTWISALKQ